MESCGPHRGSYLEKQHITLTEVLKAAGYQTSAYLSAGAIGKHTEHSSKL